MSIAMEAKVIELEQRIARLEAWQAQQEYALQMGAQEQQRLLTRNGAAEHTLKLKRG